MTLKNNSTLEQQLWSAQMSSMRRSMAEFIHAGLAYPDVTAVRYLLNFTYYNYLLVTARVLMTPLAAEAHTKAKEIILRVSLSTSRMHKQKGLRVPSVKASKGGFNWLPCPLDEASNEKHIKMHLVIAKTTQPLVFFSFPRSWIWMKT